MIKALYTDVESFAYFNGVSTQTSPLRQGSWQGRILVASMNELYINTYCDSKYSLVIDNLRIGSPTFADDLTEGKTGHWL